MTDILGLYAELWNISATVKMLLIIALVLTISIIICIARLIKIKLFGG